MNGPTTEPLEAILQHCAASAPEPWYPRLHAEAIGINRDSLDPPLERLRTSGLIRLTDWMPGKGQGYVLTPEGKEALASRRTLIRYLSGPVVVTPAPAAEETPLDRFEVRQDRGRLIRDSLLSSAPPLVTYALIAANLSVFFFGIYLAKIDGLPLPDMMKVAPTILHRTGSVSADDLLKGQWWRLLTSCFVHLGWLHIGMNMFVLLSLGPLAERMWGSVRYLFLYLITGLGGSCVAMLVKPMADDKVVELGGASGALWGVMVGMAVWVFLNRRYLPSQMAATWQRQLVTMIVLNVFISFIPGVSAAGHFGGGGTGLVVALLLHAQRFGTGIVRALSWIALPLVPVVCVVAVARAPDFDPSWKQLAGMDAAQRELVDRRGREEAAHRESNEFQEIQRTVRRLDLQAKESYAQKASPALELKPPERTPQVVKEALTALDQGKEKLAEAARLLDNAGPYAIAQLEEARRIRREFLGERMKLFDLAERCLRDGEKWSPEDEQGFIQQARRLHEAERRWQQLLR